MSDKTPGPRPADSSGEPITLPPEAVEDVTAAPPPPPKAATPRFDRSVLAILLGMGVLAVVVVWLLASPRQEANGDPTLHDRVAALETAQRDIPARIGAVETAQRALPDRLAALETAQRALPERLTALETAQRALPERLAALETAQRGLPDRLTALESRPMQDAAAQAGLTRLGDRLQATEQAAAERAANTDRRLAAAEAAAQRPVADPALLANLAGRTERVVERLGMLEGRAADQDGRSAAAAAALDRRVAAAEVQVTQRLANADAAVTQRVATLENSLAARIQVVEARESRLRETEQRLSRLVAAVAGEAALTAGRPLGPALAGLQGQAVPPSLTRYADGAPPTESALRLSFDESARAAQAAVDPGARGTSVMESAAQRLAGLVTIRRGEQVVWGDAASADLEAARRALDAGDIAGAVERIGKLPAPAQAAMAGWVEQAKALLEARAAMRGLATGG